MALGRWNIEGWGRGRIRGVAGCIAQALFEPSIYCNVPPIG